jgi:hypothetical protein
VNGRVPSWLRHGFTMQRSTVRQMPIGFTDGGMSMTSVVGHVMKEMYGVWNTRKGFAWQTVRDPISVLLLLAHRAGTAVGSVACAFQCDPEKDLTHERSQSSNSFSTQRSMRSNANVHRNWRRFHCDTLTVSADPFFSSQTSKNYISLPLPREALAPSRPRATARATFQSSPVRHSAYTDSLLLGHPQRVNKLVCASFCLSQHAGSHLRKVDTDR